MNNIAIGFEQAEHYTLQEACDYLNLKHNTTNITPKKLIKHIYQRSIKCYVYIQSDYGKDKSYQDKDNCGFGSGADLSDKLNKMFCKPMHPTLDESVKIKERDRENICIVLDMAFSHNFLGRLCSFGLKQVAGIQPKRGVSPHKIQAKEQAKIIAKVLWNNDKDQKIRVAEMARTVYAELYDCGFDEQLPQNQDSLQDWIREVAPPYAKMGGRPKNEP